MIKMVTEAVIMISWHYNTMEMRNKSKSEHVAK